MHMADALVTPVVAGTMYLSSGAAGGYSIKKLKQEMDEKKIPVMGVMGAFVFAAQMINFSIPGTGSSGHLAGGMLLSALLGPYAGFLTMIGILTIQCLIFADGGLLALGCNIWNMAFYGCFVGAFVIWKLILRNGITKKKLIAGSIIGSMLTLELGALSVTLETLASGVTELPFVLFAGTMLPIHLVIGLVEGIITAAVLCFVYEARPELLWEGIREKTSDAERKGFLGLRQTLFVFIAAFVVIGGMFSLYASSDPDGLEWSLEKVAGTSELTEDSNGISGFLAWVQERTAVLPDYSVSQDGAPIETSFSGLVGGGILLLLGMIAAGGIRYFRKKKYYEQN